MLNSNFSMSDPVSCWRGGGSLQHSKMHSHGPEMKCCNKSTFCCILFNIIYIVLCPSFMWGWLGVCRTNEGWTVHSVCDADSNNKTMRGNNCQNYNLLQFSYILQEVCTNGLYSYGINCHLYIFHWSMYCVLSIHKNWMNLDHMLYPT